MLHLELERGTTFLTPYLLLFRQAPSGTHYLWRHRVVCCSGGDVGA